MKKFHKAVKIQSNHPMHMGNIHSNLTMAELSLQRGEFESARMLLKERVIQGNTDFKTHNLYGISLAQLRDFDNAQNIFMQLVQKAPTSLQRAQASFNLGLVKFFRELYQTGDLSVAYYNTLGMMRNYGTMPTGPLFEESIEIWLGHLSKYPHRPDIAQSYLGFAYLQTGDYHKSLEMIMKSQASPENFYISSYVTGRLFLDLYYLSMEDHDFAFSKTVVEFFEIEEYEIRSKNSEQSVIHPETLLDIAMQALLDGRNQSPFCPEILLNLCHAYLLAGMAEESEEVLAQLDGLAPNHVAVLELALRFHQSVLSPPNVVDALMTRIKNTLAKNPEQQRQHIIPAYYQT